ncbi:MAG: phytanoyl-CoA dioxygenase family protein [Planctomycetota bacterium]
MSDPTPLKTVHHPVGNLFPRAETNAEVERFRLSSEQVAFYRENGFVRGPRVLDEHQIDVLREGLEKIRERQNPRTVELYEVDADYVRAPEQNVFHCLGAWMIDEGYHDILFHPAITVPVSQLLDTPRVRLWHDQVFYKPPRHPGVVTWHQDYSYWTRSIPARHITCWIGLDDSTLESGCVQFVPGSHRWNLLPMVSLTKDMDAIRDVMTPEQLAQFKPVPMELKAGECSFHHSFTLHGSYGNNANHPRRGWYLISCIPKRALDGKQPLLAHTPIVPEGQIIEGDNYPIVLDISSHA